MKTGFIRFELITVLCSVVATTAVVGQTTYTWTGAGDGTNIATAANWNPVGYPSGTSGTQDTAQWDGLTTSNLFLTYGTPGFPAGSFPSVGANLVLTANQTHSVTIASPVAQSANLSVSDIANDSAGACFVLGGTNTADLLNITCRPSGATHHWNNNSTNTAVVNQGVRFLAGGGAEYTLDFDGTGDWTVNNCLVSDNITSILIQKDGPGTMTWIPTGYLGNSSFGNPAITVNAGTLILAGNHPRLGNQAVVNNAALQYNAVAQSQTLSGVISGTGMLKVSNGTLMLTGTNSYSGGTTISGGTLQVGTNGTSGSLGSGNVTNNSSLIFNRSDDVTFSNVISGTGSVAQNGSGTLTLTRATTYSGGMLISAGALQVVMSSSLGTGNVTNNGALVFNLPNNNFININNNISGSGSVSNIGSGVCTLFGSNTYSGGTTISAGYLVFQGVKTGTGNITVADSATLDVFDTGTQVTPNTLTLGSNTACTLDFFLSGNTSTAIISAGTLSSVGTITVNIDNSPPPLTVGQSYPLLTWASGSAPTVQLGVLNLFVGNLSIVGNTLWLNITGTVTGTVYTWTGAGFAKTNLALAQNWTTNGITAATTLPSGLTQDTARWDGLTTSNLVLIYGTNSGNGFPNAGGFTFGIHLDLTANQTNSVQIISVLPASPSVGLFSLSNSSPNSSLILGDTSANNLAIVTRPGVRKFVHPFVNNSTAACVINPSVKWSAGGGVGTTYDFRGTGNWIVNNYLMPDNSATASTVQVDGPGLVFWSADSTGLYVPNGQLTNIVINGGALILKSAFPGNSGQLKKTAVANSATITYDPVNPDSQTLSGVISGTGLLQMSNGTLTLSGANTYSGGTTISGGILQVGTNGTSGSLGSGNVTNHSSLIFNRSDSATFGNAISGAGSIVQQGSGTLTLTGANTYTGSTTISNGTLVINSVGGDVNVNGGTLVPVGAGSIGTLNVAGSLNILAGTISIALNKSLSPSNSMVSVAGAISNSGGTLKLLNFGPALFVGDKFTLFDKAVTGGAAMTIVSPGFIVANDLVLDGSVTVTSVAPPAQVAAAVSGGQLNLSWPAAYTGLNLQAQTNALTIGLGTNWFNIPGTDGNNSYSNTLNNANGSVFFRLAP